MKQFFCSILLFLCFVVTTNAQETHFGVKAGLNYSSIIGDITNGIKFRFSVHAGVYLEVELADKFSFHPELL